MKLLCFLVFALSSLGFSAQNPKTELWAEILQGAVSDSGEVDYIWIDKHSSKLEEFVESYRSTNPGRWNESEKKAYYLNFYNASMIYNLLRYARSSNIKVDSKDFLSLLVNKISVPGGNIWNGDFKVFISNQAVNLDEIEHGLIRGKILESRKNWHLKQLDPRVHAALNCAAVSCPILSNTPFMAQNVENKLEELFITWLGEDYQFKKINSNLRINKIIKWYYDDFAAFSAPSSWKSCDGSQYRSGTGNYLCHYLKLSTAPNKSFKAEVFKSLNTKSSLYNPFNSFFFEYDWHINSKSHMSFYLSKLK